MGKQFDSKNFKSKLKKNEFILVMILLLGIVSIICGVTMGNGTSIFSSKDPKDYYAVYSAEVSGYTMKFDIRKDKCIIQYRGETTNCEYEYFSSTKAQELLGNDAYKNYDAIAIYTDSSKQEAICLWITSNNPYKFVINGTGDTVTRVSDNVDTIQNTEQN